MAWAWKKVMTESERAIIFLLQGGRCAICGRLPVSRSLDLDHNHRTGRARGGLCHRHNRGLQWFSDRPDLLRKAADYLEKYDGA